MPIDNCTYCGQFQGSGSKCLSCGRPVKEDNPTTKPETANPEDQSDIEQQEPTAPGEKPAIGSHYKAPVALWN